MHLSEILTRELDALRSRIGRDALDILETGSIRGVGQEYQCNDGWSTLTLAESVAERGGSLASIDLDTDAADTVLALAGVRQHVTLLRGHSIDVLAGVVANAIAAAKRKGGQLITGGPGFVDVAFLDSDNDGALIFHEYLVVQRIVRSPGLIIVDDVDMESTGVVKGHQIVPWLVKHGMPYRLEKRHGDDYQTGVLIIEV